MFGIMTIFEPIGLVRYKKPSAVNCRWLSLSLSYRCLSAYGQDGEIVEVAGCHGGVLEGDIVTAASEPCGAQNSAGHILHCRIAVHPAQCGVCVVVACHVISYSRIEELTAHKSAVVEEEGGVRPHIIELRYSREINLIIHVAVDCVTAVIEVVKSGIEGYAEGQSENISEKAAAIDGTIVRRGKRAHPRAHYRPARTMDGSHIGRSVRPGAISVVVVVGRTGSVAVIPTGTIVMGRCRAVVARRSVIYAAPRSVVARTEVVAGAVAVAFIGVVVGTEIITGAVAVAFIGVVAGTEVVTGTVTVAFIRVVAGTEVVAGAVAVVFIRVVARTEVVAGTVAVVPVAVAGTDMASIASVSAGAVRGVVGPVSFPTVSAALRLNVRCGQQAGCQNCHCAD